MRRTIHRPTGSSPSWGDPVGRAAPSPSASCCLVPPRRRPARPSRDDAGRTRTMTATGRSILQPTPPGNAPGRRPLLLDPSAKNPFAGIHFGPGDTGRRPRRAPNQRRGPGYDPCSLPRGPVGSAIGDGGLDHTAVVASVAVRGNVPRRRHRNRGSAADAAGRPAATTPSAPLARPSRSAASAGTTPRLAASSTRGDCAATPALERPTSPDRRRGYPSALPTPHPAPRVPPRPAP